MPLRAMRTARPWLRCWRGGGLMASVTIETFCEDSGHETFTRALIDRLAREEGISVRTTFRVSRGGAGKVLAELRAHQRLLARGRGSAADLLLVVVDANCVGWAKKRADVEEILTAEGSVTAAIGCPDPHVERWLLADADAFQNVVGGRPPADPGKCERDLYKQLLADGFAQHNFMTITGPMEAATDIVPQMKLAAIGAAYRSLEDFVSTVRGCLKRLK